MARQTQISPRAQQHATRAAFFIPGFAVATWAPLVPFAKARASMDEATLGLVLLCLGAGALLSMPLAGAMATRHGCRKILVAAQLLICATLPLLTLAGLPWLLGAVLFLFGAGLGAMDSTMNVQAVMVERDSGRAMMSGFHAWYSIGGLVGAAGMTALLAAGIAPWPASLLVTALILWILALSCRHWRTDRQARDAPALAWPRGAVMLLGVLCFIMFMAEGSMLDWSAVFLHEVRGVEAARAGQGFAVFSLTMTLARLLGDALVQQLGRARTAMLGGMCACAGLLTATLVPAWQATLAGYALAGLGCANIVPVLFSLAGQQKSMPEGLAVPAITTLGYAGVLAGPAMIGFLARATSLATAFVAVAAAIMGLVVATRWLRSA
jgi:predicted MFS family arabinose efflux permease